LPVAELRVDAADGDCAGARDDATMVVSRAFKHHLTFFFAFGPDFDPGSGSVGLPACSVR
jgi:hypothetical protein